MKSPPGQLRSATQLLVIVTFVLFKATFAQALDAKTSVDADRTSAVQTLRRYIECEKAGSMADCFSLLSKGALKHWADQGVSTKEGYAKDKTSEEARFGDFTIQKTIKSGQTIIIKTKIKRFGEGEPTGGGIAKIEFYFVNEGGQWKMDKMMEGTYEYLP